ncbi:MAG: hypothetical protein HY673_20875 [Chloroflexi bacterium]|nr:hypothetical protein [Chloroflexota bacterium]
MTQEEMVEVAKNDLLAAWAVLENLAVSLDQIGGVFGRENDAANGSENRPALQEALGAYLTPELVKAINDARMRLGQYVPDEEAEAMSERIAYWDCATAPKVTSETG